VCLQRPRERAGRVRRLPADSVAARSAAGGHLAGADDARLRGPAAQVRGREARAAGAHLPGDDWARRGPFRCRPHRNAARVPARGQVPQASAARRLATLQPALRMQTRPLLHVSLTP
jgi:hypothetical protein